MPVISQFGFPWTEDDPVEEQKHTAAALTPRDQPARLELQLPNA